MQKPRCFALVVTYLIQPVLNRIFMPDSSIQCVTQLEKTIVFNNWMASILGLLTKTQRSRSIVIVLLASNFLDNFHWNQPLGMLFLWGLQQPWLQAHSSRDRRLNLMKSRPLERASLQWHKLLVEVQSCITYHSSELCLMTARGQHWSLLHESVCEAYMYSVAMLYLKYAKTKAILYWLTLPGLWNGGMMTLSKGWIMNNTVKSHFIILLQAFFQMR